MTETRTIHDPFLNESATISARLVDRLRGKYAVGPTLPNGEPEFGWRQHETPPINSEAADEIDRLRAEVLQCSVELGEAVKLLAPHYPGTATMYDMACGRARVALGLTPCDSHQN